MTSPADNVRTSLANGHRARGFVAEAAALARLAEAGWQVRRSTTYFHPTTGDAREQDIVAEAAISTHVDMVERIVIHCPVSVTSSKDPVVAFSSGWGASYPSLRFPHATFVNGARADDQISEVRSEFPIEIVDSRVVTSISAIGKDKEINPIIYGKLRQLSEYRTSEFPVLEKHLETSGAGRHRLFFVPILCIDASLVEHSCQINSEKLIENSYLDKRVLLARWEIRQPNFQHQKITSYLPILICNLD